MLHTTQQKGLLTELKCQLFFVSKGINVYLPLSDDSKSDLIIDIDNKLYRIQIKTSRESKSGLGFCFNPYTTSVNCNGASKKHYTKDEVDFFMTLYENVFYLIPLQVTGNGEKTLSFKQTGNATLATDYEANKILSSLLGEECKEEENNMELNFTNANIQPIYTIIQKHPVTKEIVGKFLSAADASRKLFNGDVSKQNSISRAARGERNTAFGYIWEKVG